MCRMLKKKTEMFLLLSTFHSSITPVGRQSVCILSLCKLFLSSYALKVTLLKCHYGHSTRTVHSKPFTTHYEEMRNPEVRFITCCLQAILRARRRETEYHSDKHDSPIYPYIYTKIAFLALSGIGSYGYNVSYYLHVFTDCSNFFSFCSCLSLQNSPLLSQQLYLVLSTHYFKISGMFITLCLTKHKAAMLRDKTYWV